MRLVLSLTPSDVTFTAVNSGGAYPLLSSVGGLRIVARAGGRESGETPSLQVALDNRGKRAASIIGSPLRKRASVYADDGSLFFAGILSRVTYGRVIDMTMES